MSTGDGPVKVLLPEALRSYTHAARVEAAGATLDALFDDLDRRYPGLRFRVVDEQNRLRPNMRIFVNGLGVRDLGHGLQAEDFVAVVLALSGG
ncbi:MoaD/ThiS family protein [Caldimonas sp. KR1-144]|uniref:MoaD/ThiS family protein n=1 Tax=Caldimonas sp. KR1-144 TaxID=3400911 RepID=UPI003C0755F2